MQITRNVFQDPSASGKFFNRKLEKTAIVGFEKDAPVFGKYIGVNPEIAFGRKPSLPVPV